MTDRSQEFGRLIQMVTYAETSKCLLKNPGVKWVNDELHADNLNSCNYTVLKTAQMIEKLYKILFKLT